jgi:hypothetical protein
MRPRFNKRPESCQTPRATRLKVIDVLTRTDHDLRYRAVEIVVGGGELDAALRAAIEEIGAGEGPPFAIFHGPVDEATRSRLEVGVPDSGGDRLFPGGLVATGSGPAEADYDAIHVVYDAIADFIRTNGYSQRAGTREVYHDDRIEIVWPIEER